jgi:cytosine/adenosine deaminase-related metal-dependent hydrolase
MKLGSGIAPVSALLAHGVNVALGTDGAASNNRLDLFGEMRVASLLAKVAAGDPSVLPAQQALHGDKVPAHWVRRASARSSRAGGRRRRRPLPARRCPATIPFTVHAAAARRDRRLGRRQRRLDRGCYRGRRLDRARAGSGRNE